MIGICVGLVVIAGACIVWVIHTMRTAPCGVEIPGIGFVEIDEVQDD